MLHVLGLTDNRGRKSSDEMSIVAKIYELQPANIRPAPRRKSDSGALYRGHPRCVNDILVANPARVPGGNFRCLSMVLGSHTCMAY